MYAIVFNSSGPVVELPCPSRYTVTECFFIKTEQRREQNIAEESEKDFILRRVQAIMVRVHLIQETYPLSQMRGY